MCEWVGEGGAGEGLWCKRSSSSSKHAVRAARERRPVRSPPPLSSREAPTNERNSGEVRVHDRQPPKRLGHLLQLIHWRKEGKKAAGSERGG